MTERALRFGLQLGSTGAADVVATARRAEAAGFDVVHTSDHVGAGLLPPLTPLAGIAVATERIRLCPLVVNNDLHHPVDLAREVVAIDHLSRGRMELGIGAGHSFTEYGALGLAFDPPAVRKARLAESVELLRRLLDGDTVDHAGEHYTLRGAARRCVPCRSDSRSSWASTGATRSPTRRVHADVVGLTMLGRTLADGQRHETRWEAARLDQTVAHVRETARRAGRDPEIQVLVQGVQVTDDRDGAARAFVEQGAAPTVDDALATPFLAIGTHGQIARHLHECRERWGITYFSVRDLDGFAPVIARLRSS